MSYQQTMFPQNDTLTNKCWDCGLRGLQEDMSLDEIGMICKECSTAGNG